MTSVSIRGTVPRRCPGVVSRTGVWWWSAELGEPVDDGACWCGGGGAEAGPGPQVQAVRVPGGRRGLPEAAGQVVDRGVAGRCGRVVLIGEPVAQRAGGAP